MSFLPIASVGQALQVAALAQGAVSVARAGFDRLLRAALDDQPATSSDPAPALGPPAARQSAASSHFGLTTRLQSFAEALRERLLPHFGSDGFGADGLEVTVTPDGTYRVNQPGGVADAENLFAADDGLRAVVERIAQTLTDFTQGGGSQVARFTLTATGADVQTVPA
jgi:hypothetical protein